MEIICGIVGTMVGLIAGFVLMVWFYKSQYCDVVYDWLDAKTEPFFDWLDAI